MAVVKSQVVKGDIVTVTCGNFIGGNDDKGQRGEPCGAVVDLAYGTEVDDRYTDAYMTKRGQDASADMAQYVRWPAQVINCQKCGSELQP